MTRSGFLRGEDIREHQKWYKCYTRCSTSRYRKLPSSPTTSLSIMARYLIGKRFFKRRQDWDFLLRCIWRRQRDWRHQWRAWWGCWWFDSFLVRVLSMPRWGNGYFHSTIQFFNNIYLYTVVTLCDILWNAVWCTNFSLKTDAHRLFRWTGCSCSFLLCMYLSMCFVEEL